MSTKATIKFGKGFHLYRECLSKDDIRYVHLELDDVDFTVMHSSQGSTVCIEIPWEMAKSLGLINEEPTKCVF